MVRVIQRLPFLPVVAVIFGWAVGTIILAMPAWQFDAVLAAIVPHWLPPLLHPPLGALGRFMWASLAACTFCVLILFPSWALRRWRRTQRLPVAVPKWPGPARQMPHDTPVPGPELNKFPEFLGAASQMLNPADASEFLLEDGMRMPTQGAILASEQASFVPEEAPTKGVHLADQGPVRLPQPDPVFIREPAPVRPPTAHQMRRAEDRRDKDSNETVAELLDRIERGLEKRCREENMPAIPSWANTAFLMGTGGQTRPH